MAGCAAIPKANAARLTFVNVRTMIFQPRFRIAAAAKRDSTRPPWQTRSAIANEYQYH
jgi:hypothetical protein